MIRKTTYVLIPTRRVHVYDRAESGHGSSLIFSTSYQMLTQPSKYQYSDVSNQTVLSRFFLFLYVRYFAAYFMLSVKWQRMFQVSCV